MARTGNKNCRGEGSQEDTDIEIIEEQTAPSMLDTTVGASTGTEDNPSNMYLDQITMLAQLWSENVRTGQAGAYRELMEQLLELAHEIFSLLVQADAGQY